MAKYELDDVIPNCWSITFIHVFGASVHYTCLGDDEHEITFRQLLQAAGFDFNLPTPTFIIVEQPMGGIVYQIGNYTDNIIYEHGKTNGYA